jgi:hypothetical protein
MRLRLWLTGAAAIALLVALIGAGVAKPEPNYSRADVVRAFAAQAYELAEPGYTPSGSHDATGVFLMPRPFRSSHFYVFVALRQSLAASFYEQLVRGGPTPDAFDLLRRNVIVSSDSSFTENGLTITEKRRIRAAMNALSTGSAGATSTPTS